MDTPNGTDENQDEPGNGTSGPTPPDEPAKTETDETRIVEHRPWIPPLIASAVLLVIILILLLPRVLIYPEDTDITTSGLSPSTMDQAEASLEARVETLRSMLETGVCVADGEYTYRDPGLAEGLGLDEDDLRQATVPSIDPPTIQPPQDLDGDGEPDPAAPQTAQPSVPTTPMEHLSAHLDASVVLVLADQTTPGSDDGTGSGFFITNELIVTNGHVVGPMGAAEVYVVNNVLQEPVPAEVIASTGTPRFGEPDFALLRLSAPATGIRTATLTDVPSALTSVVSAGFPGVMLESDADFQAMLSGQSNRVPVMTKWPGSVIAVQSAGTGQIVVHSAQITPGNSGGPLSDMCGRVVGVNTFIVEDQTTGEHLYKALSTSVLTSWLSQNGVSLNIDDTSCAPATHFGSPPSP